MPVGRRRIFPLNLNVGKDGGQWSPDSLRRKNTQRPLNRRVVGPQNQPVWPLGEQKNFSPLSALEPRFFSLQSLSTDIWRLEYRVMGNKQNSIACKKPFSTFSVVCATDFLRFVLCCVVFHRSAAPSTTVLLPYSHRTYVMTANLCTTLLSLLNITGVLTT